MSDLAIDARADIEVLRAYLYTYTVDRLGRPAPLESRYLAHDALDRLERGDA